MSVPGFHRHFKAVAVTTMTPVQLQKQVRLQEARRRLVAAEEVARVGFAIGYENLSQFSRDYRGLFGAHRVAMRPPFARNWCRSLHCPDT